MGGRGAPCGWRAGTGRRLGLMVRVPPQLESEYLRIPGDQVVSVVFIK